MGSSALYAPTRTPTPSSYRRFRSYGAYHHPDTATDLPHPRDTMVDVPSGCRPGASSGPTLTMRDPVWTPQAATAL